MDRYMRYVRDREPVLSASLIAAFLLALVDRVVGLTDGDLTILGPLAVIIGGAILRQLVYSPESYMRALHRLPPDDEGE